MNPVGFQIPEMPRSLLRLVIMWNTFVFDLSYDIKAYMNMFSKTEPVRFPEGIQHESL